MSCFVKSCKNNKRLLFPSSNITFHRFPREPDLFRNWLIAIGRKDKNISWRATMFICSKHFSSDDFKGVSPRRVKKGRVPWLNITTNLSETHNKVSQLVELYAASESIPKQEHPVLTTAPLQSFNIKMEKNSIKVEDNSFSNQMSSKEMFKLIRVEKMGYFDVQRKLCRTRQRIKLLKQEVNALQDTMTSLKASRALSTNLVV